MPQSLMAEGKKLISSWSLGKCEGILCRGNVTLPAPGFVHHGGCPILAVVGYLTYAYP